MEDSYTYLLFPILAFLGVTIVFYFFGNPNRIPGFLFGWMITHGTGYGGGIESAPSSGSLRKRRRRTPSKHPHRRERSRFNATTNDDRSERHFNPPQNLDYLRTGDPPRGNRMDGTSSSDSEDERRGIITQVSFDIEEELKMPYAVAVIENFSKEVLVEALEYRHKKGCFTRDSNVIVHTIEHLAELKERRNNSETSHVHGCFLKEFSEDDIREICKEGKIREQDMKWVTTEHRQIYGYPPSPKEFLELYEKTVERDNFMKEITELRKCNADLEKRDQTNTQEIQDLRKGCTRLEMEVHRHLCKCCRVNDVSVVFKPCQHAVYCSRCIGRLKPQLKKQRNYVCPMCKLHIKSESHFYLS